MYFPNEYNDCEAGKIENNRIKEELLKKYSAKPASKRVNYIINGFLNPFYCPFNSIVDKNLKEEKPFFVLRNLRFLTKLKTYFFDQNKVNKDKFIAELKSTVVNFDEILNNSYINVRLSAFERGTIATYSQIYAHNDEENVESIDLNVFKQVMSSLKKIEKSDEKEFYEISDEKFFKLHLDELKKKNPNENLIGFVINSKFSLVNGQCNANAAIRTNFFIDTLLKKADIIMIVHNWPRELFTVSSIISVIIILFVTWYILFKEKEFWKIVALIVFIMLLTPLASADYRLLYIFLPMAFFVNSLQKTKYDSFYTVLFGLLLVPKSYMFHTTKESLVLLGVLVEPLLMIFFAYLIIKDGLKSKSEKINVYENLN